ncbi:class I SAM-dependent methyltransferase [Streptomyces sp. 5.8]|uniref:class I SAM-dependent methyltransferase n=1 Tax=Streptomyces sp. 5.8 TaxID=3406571 RepID=UPI003BB5AD26
MPNPAATAPTTWTEVGSRADALGRTADLREGDAQALPFPDVSFDTVVCTLSLCAIPTTSVPSPR